jgi:serine phosphatase RsbU (regulator of sigma subunit)
MKFIRDSLTKKAILLFTFLATAIVVGAVVLFRKQVLTLPITYFLIGLIGLLLICLLAFLLDVMVPLSRVARQVKNLLGGKNYQRIPPTTVDEIGMFTHFFNEITRDLEKISYDVRERRRMTSELDIAAQIQHDVLPKSAPESPGLDIVAKTRAATEIGGDSFDFLKTADGQQTILYIGDVTGHGVPSGVIMMMVNTIIRSLLVMGANSTRDLVVWVNNLLTPKISSRLFMTLVMLRWDSENQRLYYTGAGHEHILVYRQKTEKVEAIRSGGIALGMIPDNSMIAVEKEIPSLEPGDTLLLYSDGITEAKNKTGEMFTIQRLVDSLQKNGYYPSAESVFDHVTKDFANFVGEYVQIDDCSMIAIKVIPKGTGAKMKLAIADEKARTAAPSKVWDWNS